MPPRVPNAIRSFRLQHDPPLRQRDLALRLGIDKAEVSRYEAGMCPALPRAIQIALALGRTVEEVFFGHHEALALAAAAADEVSAEPGG